MDFTLEALNHAYPGCTGVYLDRGGHMLAFYSRKGSPKAGLIQDVAVEAGQDLHLDGSHSQVEGEMSQPR